MINFREIRGLLIAGIVREGFAERQEKSCRRYRVFSDGTATLLVQPNEAGVYDYYTNQDDPDDYGDVTQFVLRRRFGIRTHGELSLTKQEYFRLQGELERIGAFASTLPHYRNDRQTEGKKFRPEEHDIMFFGSTADIPATVTAFLRRRGITADATHADIAGTIAALRSPAGYHNALFVWRYADGRIAGAQYKYMVQDRCVKRFLPHSDKENSLWYTAAAGKKALMVCEDPLDALAHRQLFQEKDYAYACTGGTVTAAQIRLIRELAASESLPLIVGNDNDTAGQLMSLRLALPEARITYDRKAGIVTVLHTVTKDGDIVFTTDAVTVAELLDYLCKQAAGAGIGMESPPHPAKDWNEALMGSIKAV